MPGLAPSDYHLDEEERLPEVINRAWNSLLGAWATFQDALGKLPAGDPATAVTREKWLLKLFRQLGYGQLQSVRPIQLAGDAAGRSFPISHEWGSVPIHLIGARVPLDRRTLGVTGASTTSPHGLLQDLLNASDQHLWGVVSNGITLRLLRDNLSLTRQAYIEFDLQAMMEGEVYADFAVLFLVLHESRLEPKAAADGGAARPENCWLERWSREAEQQGTRALEALRDGVKHAIEALGRGFLAHSMNGALRTALRGGSLDAQDYYRQLLRVVYRLLFLFVAEDRDILFAPTAPIAAKERYTSFYSLGRLRRLAERKKGTPHADLWRGLRLVIDALGSDEGCAPLGLPALGSFLWSKEAAGAIASCDLANADLLDAIRALAFVVEGQSKG